MLRTDLARAALALALAAAMPAAVHGHEEAAGPEGLDDASCQGLADPREDARGQVADDPLGVRLGRGRLIRRLLIAAGAGLIVTTAGLSVDPDDVTRQGLLDAGGTDLVYGAPILPGAMTLVARIGRVDDVVRAIRFLLDDAPFMTGSVIRLDGGYPLGGEAVAPMPEGVV